MFSKRIPCFAFFLCLFLAVVSLTPAGSQTLPSKPQVPSRIVSPIDDAVRITIPRSTHPLANSAFDVGPVDGSTAMPRILLVLGGSADQEYQARTLLDSLHTKGSPDYHHWLTPEEYGQKFGPSQQDIAQVTGWLQQHGFTIGQVAKSGRWIEFSGTSAQVEAAFQTRMRQYMVSGEMHIANANNVSIPAALAPVVRSVLSLHNFFSKPMIRRSQTVKRVTVDRSKPTANDGSGNHFLTPGDLAAIYNLTPLYNGTSSLATQINGSGQTIAVVAIGNINTLGTTGIDDVANFRQIFGLPVNPPNIILNGPDPGIDGSSDEATLDVEYSGAIAPNATIDLVVSGGSLTTDPVALSASFIVNQNLAPIMNVSFGVCEQALGAGATLLNDGNPFWNALWEQASAQGISVFVSSGDTGAAGCDPNTGTSNTAASGGLGVNGFGSTAFNTAVGGTEFNETVNGGVDATFWNTSNTLTFESAKGYIPEKVWNDSCAPTDNGSFCQQNNVFVFASGGGGISSTWAVPSYQTLNIQGLQGVGFSNRVVPDVSLAAANDHDPYIFCFTADPTQPDCQVNGTQVTFNNFAGGTSFSSPDFAGIMALVDQAASNGTPPAAGSRQGLANYVLYSLAATESQAAGGFGTCNSSNLGPATPPAQCVFNDVTTGNNGVPGNDTLSTAFPPGNQAGQTGYNAVAGYDPAIGLGSINATALVTNWATAANSFKGSLTTLSTTATTPITITHGTPVQFTVTVTKNPSGSGPIGNVAIVTNQAAPQPPGLLSVGGGALNSGSFTGSFRTLPGGTYNITANYPGDGTFAGSTSNAIAATVAPEATSTVLQSFIFNDNTVTATTGTSIAYADTVHILVIDADTVGASGLIPTSGTVTFSSGGSQSPPMTIDNSGIAELVDCSASCLTPGSYTINASYSGDGLSYSASGNSAPLTITVTPGNPDMSVSAPANSTAGQQITVTATVGGADVAFFGNAIQVPTGTVQFMNGSTPLGGPVTLSNGQASAQITLNTGGMQSITAQYSGDSNYNAASGQATVTVGSPFNFTAASNSQTIAAGGTATYNVTLNGTGGFAGQVSFSCTGAPGGASCAVSPNPATLSASTTSIPLTVTVSNTTNARLVPRSLKGMPFVLAGVFVTGLIGLRRKPRQIVFLCLAMFLVGGLSSCGGGGGGGGGQRGPTNAVLTVTGTSGSTSSSITLNLTVTH